MHRERVAWITGVMLCAGLALRLAGPVPATPADAAFARTLDEVRREVRDGYVDAVDDEALRSAAIGGMLEKLNDPHTIYVPPSLTDRFNQALDGNFVGVGVSIRPDERTGEIVVVSPIEGSPALAAGVEAGDVIVRVNDTPVAEVPGVGDAKVEGVSKLVRGPEGTSVNLTVRRGDEERSFAIVRRQVHLPSVVGHRRGSGTNWEWFVDPDLRIGYVRLTGFGESTAADLAKVLRPMAAEGMRGLVLDLRFNGGGRLEEAVAVADLFLKEGLIVTTRGRARPEVRRSADDGGDEIAVPLAVLVNEASASASEVVAGALQDHGRATVVGQRTFGKGSVQEVESLSNGGRLKLTIAYYYLPSGRLVHRREGAADWGVTPDVVVPLDAAGQQRVVEGWSRESVIRPATAAVARVVPMTVKIPVATQPASDPQLDAAVKALAASILVREATTRPTP